MLDWIRWMLVDSSGSMKPLARPIATTFLFQNFLRLPVAKRSTRGSASGSPSRLAITTAVASSSLMNLLLNTWPLPTRCCSGMRHCQPASRAVERVYGVSGVVRTQGTATARSQGSQWVQSV